ncbi:unnamed protein product, partial [Ixodes persulcatus]
GISEASGERRHLSNKYDVQNSPARIPRTSNIRKHVTRSLCYSRFSARLHHAPQRDVIWGNADIPSCVLCRCPRKNAIFTAKTSCASPSAQHLPTCSTSGPGSDKFSKAKITTDNFQIITSNKITVSSETLASDLDHSSTFRPKKLSAQKCV